MIRLPVVCLAWCVLTPCARAQFELPARAPATKAQLVSEVQTIAPGSTFTLALKLAHPAGWHSYYQNSGGLEQPLSIQWTMPQGFSAGPIQGPVPEVKDGFFGKSFVHTGSPVFLIDITAATPLVTATTVTLSAVASWQICEQSCLNEQATLTLVLPVGPAVEKDPATADLFAKARANQPAKPKNWQVSAQADGQDILLRIDPGEAVADDPTDFIPNQPFVQAASAGGSIRRDGNAWLIQL
ncbi:MAG: protein-disulfide reductase DsbD family protein, partial [Verrucomicrobia bacterium]|nr:protein-disulfide reductase DsbD family protein [Verrucomicrobiota bacterium]